MARRWQSRGSRGGDCAPSQVPARVGLGMSPARPGERLPGCLPWGQRVEGRGKVHRDGFGLPAHSSTWDHASLKASSLLSPVGHWDYLTFKDRCIDGVGVSK